MQGGSESGLDSSFGSVQTHFLGSYHHDSCQGTAVTERIGYGQLTGKAQCRKGEDDLFDMKPDLGDDTERDHGLVQAAAPKVWISTVQLSLTL